MIPWIPLEDKSLLPEIAQSSFQQPCLIFKHSTRCMLSAIAKMNLEEPQQFPKHIKAYLLDIIAFTEVSNAVSEFFSEYHESPQVLLIQGGECIYEASHQEISLEELLQEITLNQNLN